MFSKLGSSLEEMEEVEKAAQRFRNTGSFIDSKKRKYATKICPNV